MRLLAVRTVVTLPVLFGGDGGLKRWTLRNQWVKPMVHALKFYCFLVEFSQIPDGCLYSRLHFPINVVARVGLHHDGQNLLNGTVWKFPLPVGVEVRVCVLQCPVNGSSHPALGRSISKPP
jgi:hypothetical protein